MTRAAAFRGILRYLRPQMPLVALSLVCAAVSALAQLAVPFFVGQAIDCIVGAGEIDYARIYRLFIVIGACIAAAAAAQYAMSLINNRIVYRLLSRVRQDAFLNCSTFPSAISMHTPTARRAASSLPMPNSSRTGCFWG